jgi:hypothetical protein
VLGRSEFFSPTEESGTLMEKRDVILLRIQALERRLAPKTRSGATHESGPPRTRTKFNPTSFTTPSKGVVESARPAPPPSTLKRVMTWMWGSHATASIVTPETDKMGERHSLLFRKDADTARDGVGISTTVYPPLPLGGSNAPSSILPLSAPSLPTNHISERPAAPALPLGPPPMSALPRRAGRPAVNPPIYSRTPVHPAISLRQGLTGVRNQPHSQGELSGTTEAEIFNIRSEPSGPSEPIPVRSTSDASAPQIASMYPPLTRSISQRSAAIKALFPSIHPLGDSTSSTISTSSNGANTTGRSETSFLSGLNRKTSVKDLAKSFEEKGLLGDASGRVPSGQGEVEALKRIRSREAR